MRLIDGDALMAKLDIGQDCSICKYDDTPYCCWKPDVVDVCEAICDAPTIDPEQHWIPCSERLPNHDEYIKNNGLFIVSDGNRSYSEWYDIYGKRRFGEPTMSGFRTDYAVIAWMPLSQPYREGDK